MHGRFGMCNIDEGINYCGMVLVVISFILRWFTHVETMEEMRQQGKYMRA